MPEPFNATKFCQDNGIEPTPENVKQVETAYGNAWDAIDGALSLYQITTFRTRTPGRVAFLVWARAIQEAADINASVSAMDVAEEEEAA